MNLVFMAPGPGTPLQKLRFRLWQMHIPCPLNSELRNGVGDYARYLVWRENHMLRFECTCGTVHVRKLEELKPECKHCGKPMNARLQSPPWYLGLGLSNLVFIAFLLAILPFGATNLTDSSEARVIVHVSIVMIVFELGRITGAGLREHKWTHLYWG